MMIVEVITFIGIGLVLSIDAFFACLALGMDQTKQEKAVYGTPFLIGVMHIIFPIVACLLIYFIVTKTDGSKIESLAKWISGGIFVAMGLFTMFKKEETKESIIVSVMSILLLSLSVSIDSIVIGISYGFSFSAIGARPLYLIFIGAGIFGLISGTVSFLSIKLGKKIVEKIKNINFNIISGIFFILLGIFTFLDVL